jgi:DNA-binding GntR family transcriptional regulator
VVLRFKESVSQTTIEIHTQMLAALERGDHAAAVRAYCDQLDRFQCALEAFPDDVWD